MTLRVGEPTNESLEPEQGATRLVEAGLTYSDGGKSVYTRAYCIGMGSAMRSSYRNRLSIMPRTMQVI